MKKLILIIILLSSLESYSQISLDFQTSLRLYPVKLNNSETKYIDEGNIEYLGPTQFSLFNLDGSLYKTILLPPKPDPDAYLTTISFVSTTLFDNDPSNIEYLLDYQWNIISIGNVEKVIVAREDGTILLDEMYATTYYFRPLIYGTEQGTKLMLFYAFPDSVNYQTKVFSLPGEPPVSVDSEIDQINNNTLIFPNPNNGSFSIKINSKSGDVSTINLYEQNGRLIDTYQSSGSQTQTKNYKIPDGLYFINSHSKNYNSTTKIIIKK
jgi:hypothetical protein